MTDRSETLARIEQENELAMQGMTNALDAVYGALTEGEVATGRPGSSRTCQPRDDHAASAATPGKGSTRSPSVSDLHSVRADLHPEPTPEEDAARLEAWLEDIRAVRLELDAHGYASGRALHNGPAAMGAWHEHHARLLRIRADRHDWCAEILRRQAWREQDAFTEEREEQDDGS